MRTRLGALYGVMIANAGSLVGTSVVTSGLGFVYWWLAAHQFPPQAVGVAVAAISPMMLLANVGMLGLGTLLMGELPRSRGHEGPLVSTALCAAGAAGFILGLVFAIGAPLVAPNMPLNDSLATVTLFALGVSLTTITLVVDQVLIGLARGDLQFGRNAVFAIVKLAALAPAGLWLAGADGMTIYATWAFGNLVSVIVLAWLARGRTAFHRPEFDLLRRIGRKTLAHHGLNLALQAPSLALPIVVAAVLSAAATAYFYTTWMVVAFIFIGPFALTLALYADGSADPSRLTDKIRFTLSLASAIGLAANLFALLAANQMLALFGAAYAEGGAATLRILAFAVWPLIVKDHYIAVRRIEGQVAHAAAFVAAGAAAEIALAAAGAALGGLAGLAVGWVVALSIEAVLIVRTVYRAAATGYGTGPLKGHARIQTIAVVSAEQRSHSMRQER